MELADFTAVLDEMTRNTYIMIIVHNPTIGIDVVSLPLEVVRLTDFDLTETAALKINIRMARSKFEQLQSGTPTAS
jgi:Ras-related GTP-binding protein A/B